jgi:GT2 family glycosyltransferase
MSVVIVTPDCYETIGRTISHLREQTVPDQLELVIVGPTAGILDNHESELAGFGAIRIVETERMRSLAEANAAGAREASCPVVAFMEGHVYPDPSWAEALIEAHRHPWAVVGPVVKNANPQSHISRSEMLIGYGPWLDPTPGGTVAHLPGHNSSYKRSILLEYDDRLEALLEAESVLHWDLSAKGHRLYLEPAAKISHLNASLFPSMLRERLNSGRFFAATRARDWSPARRLIYAGSAPLIPLVRMWRILGHLRRSGGVHRLPLTMVPLVLFGLSLSAFGESMGYALGLGDSVEKGFDVQFHRERHINKDDLKLIQS